MTNDLELLTKKEVRDNAIEFAIYLLSRKVTKVGFDGQTEEYSPKEFQLMAGNLIHDSGEIYKDFIKEMYGATQIYKLKK